MKVKVYEIQPNADMNKCCEINLEAIKDMIELAEIGDMITIKVSEMEEYDYWHLPEFEGF
jgi:hypothetical protein